MIDLLSKWLKEDCDVQVYSPQLSTAPQQVAAYDPYRFCSIVSADSAATELVWLGSNVAAKSTIVLTTSYPFQVWLEGDIGSAVTWPIWAAAASGTPNFRCMTLAYNRNKAAAYDRIIKRLLSNAGAL